MKSNRAARLVGLFFVGLLVFNFPALPLWVSIGGRPAPGRAYVVIFLLWAIFIVGIRWLVTQKAPPK